MSGHKFPTTQATEEALSENVKGIANAKGCGLSYIYSVASGGDKDPYIDFREKWFCHVAEGNPTGARAYIRDMTEIVLKFENNSSTVSNEPVADLVAETTALYAAFMTSRDRCEPVEKQKALLVQWMEAAARVAVSLDRECVKRKLNVA